MINLQSPGALAQLSKQLKTDIDNWCADKYNEGPRSHLGASVIGGNCAKAMWLAFRWAAHKRHCGQQQRLFQRGHFEEPRFCGYLEGIGFKVTLFDDANLAEADKGKRQIRISACKGHFGGSIDGIAERDGQRFLTEFKTQGSGKDGKAKKFKELQEKGVKICKSVHFAQMSMYGYKLGLKYAIYMSVLKNDDDLHVEVVELDHFLGASLERKAEMIIFSEEPPNGVSCSPAFFECQWCDMKGVCYGTEQPLRNCRSCRHAKPVDEAQWLCEHCNAFIPKEAIPFEYQCWESII